MITLGILADFPSAATGMAVVCHNLANEIAKMEKCRVIYFGRWGIEEAMKTRGLTSFEEQHGYSDEFSGKTYAYVPVIGGVWQDRLVKELIEKFGVQIVFSEDDWFSAEGLVKATQKYKVPFHFLTPIDSLPIPREAYKIFRKCTKVYVPNRSYQLIKNGHFLPHGVDSETFFPTKKKFKEFTFLWMGRDEERKALGRAILAFEKVYDKVDMRLAIRTGWRTINKKTGKGGLSTLKYLKQHPEMPILRDEMTNCLPSRLNTIYNACHVFLCTSKAGGFEMSVTEAMSSGIPVLCTDMPFMNEHIINEKNGFLIPIESYCTDPWGHGRMWGNISIEKLAEKMLWCAQNPEKVKVMGNWASKWVRKKYKWEDQAKTLIREMGI